ncbi:MAG: hypothetical protein EX269_09090 [Acidimicrobiales bacterium]|nr:MAG: hypothetical protein EX269_09090 [Acidimicrobiales bacterium]
MRTRSRILSALLGLTLVATACGSDSSSGPGGVTGEVDLDRGEFALTAGLAAFDDCNALLNHLRTEGAERVGPYGFDGGGWYGPVDGIAVDVMEGDDAMEEGAMDTATDAGGETSAPTTAQGSNSSAGSDGDDSGGAVEGVDFSGTNNQEEGVDEPDIVKTNGTRILTMTNGNFTYVDTNDGDPEKRGSLRIGYDVQDMLVVNDRVLAFGTTWGEEVYYEGEEFFLDDAEADLAEDSIRPPIQPEWYGPRAKLVEIDISNPDAPKISGELLIEGHYLSARLVDGKAQVVVQSEPNQLEFVYPQNRNGEDRAKEFNAEIVRETEIADWLPEFTMSANGTEQSGTLTDCANVHAPADFAGFGALSVLTVDMTEPMGVPTATSVLASGQNVYASTDTIWMATNQWIDWAAFDDEGIRREWEESVSTQLHGFDITGDFAEYLASGSVRGHLLNQFSMSEHENVLRVATTDGPAWWSTEDSESYVTTFGIDGKELRQLGQVGDMGKGERIFAVRFVGSTAYVVTFRQTDPFYTVDLTDPANPRVLGELKISGYSGQLHPIGENLIIGIGQEATNEGFTTGAKLTVFDVSNLANPVDLDTWTLDNAWTDAEWSHHAFLYWAPENLAVIPIQSWQDRFWGAVAFRIDPDSGQITEAGRLSHEPNKDVKVGTTDCQVLDAAVLEGFKESNSPMEELAWEGEYIIQDGGQIQLCDEGEGGAAGLHCERWFGYEVVEADGLRGVPEICFPEGPQNEPIIRTLVTGGDTLWSLSGNRLQANDLSELTAGPWVTLS